MKIFLKKIIIYLFTKFPILKKNLRKFNNFLDLNSIPTNRDQWNNLCLNKKNIRLHLGCGTNYFEGWINVDSLGDEFTFGDGYKIDIVHNLINPIPLPNESVDYIFHDNFLEHLTYDDGLNFLRENYRLLKKGGVLRIVIPDLEDICKNYINNTYLELKIKGLSFREYYQNYPNIYKNRAGYINYFFRLAGQHKYLYDYESLADSIELAGFDNKLISRENTGYSKHHFLNNLDKYPGLCIEVIK